VVGPVCESADVFQTEVLLPPLEPGSQRRPEFGPEFFESEYLARWMQALADPEIEEACRRTGRTLGFLPHPNLQDALSDTPVPAHVQRLGFVDTDVRRLFARAALLVTDYSSMAFNAAYLDRPVVYYQFDRDRVSSGDHVGRTGYFDYERDGFGPVTTTHEELVAAVVAALERGPEPAPAYAARITDTFPLRDGQCCARVTRAIRDLDRPVPPQRSSATMVPADETA